jgi:two-component system, LytTR family, response regulator
MIRALVVDDEALAREALREILQEEGAFEIVRECKNGREAVQAIQKEKLDVVFLDVRMPLLDGFEVVEQVGADKMPLTVFVTAYDSFAIKAFEAQALDYVLKPFDEERFRKTIERIKRQLSRDQDGGRTKAEAAPAGLEDKLRAVLDAYKPGYLDRLPVRTSGRVVFLQMAEIRWIESAGNYVQIFTAEEPVIMRETLSNLEQRLDPNRFIRIHRSTIVNVEHVKELRPWYTGEYIVIMNGGKELTLARRYRHLLKRLLNEPVEEASAE